jgi:hypothetical protein
MAKQNRIKEDGAVFPQQSIGPSQEEIQQKAYEIYEEKGGGDPLDNWLEAERLCKLKEHASIPQ